MKDSGCVPPGGLFCVEQTAAPESRFHVAHIAFVTSVLVDRVLRIAVVKLPGAPRLRIHVRIDDRDLVLHRVLVNTREPLDDPERVGLGNARLVVALPVEIHSDQILFTVLDLLNKRQGTPLDDRVIGDGDELCFNSH